jgi:nucleotide-binding universal stress UspA family protein
MFRGSAKLPAGAFACLLYSRALVRFSAGMVSAPAKGVPTINHIVVPVDFGEASDAALAYARMLALRFNASMSVVHVYDDEALARGTVLPPDVPVRPSADIREDARHQLHVRLTRLLRPGDAPQGTSVEVLHGPTSKAIVEYADQCGASLIVMGTHGRHGLVHAVLGSVAAQVLRLASCPVLIVRRQSSVGSATRSTSTASAGPRPRWSSSAADSSRLARETSTN